MPVTTEYAFIKNGVVDNVLVCDESFALGYKIEKGYDDAVLRPSNVGIGHLYHNGKFWRETAEAEL